MCELEVTLKRTQIQQLTANAELGYMTPFSKRKGVIARKLGDVIYLMKCLAVEVTLGKPKYCTNEVPVIFNGTDQYMLPSSGILTKKATKVACTSLTPVLYKVGHLWYKNNGKSLIRTLPPKKLKMEDSLKSGINFEHLRVKKFDENGLYEQKTLVKTHFLFFQPHDVKLVNEDSGQGLIDGGNQYSYDLAPISSSKGVMHWAKKR